MTGFTDTTVSGYYRLRPLGRHDIRFGLDMDLPTGVSRLKTRDLPAIQDEDLVALQRFGEGFDVNPTVIVYHNFGDWGLGGGIGYLWTGEYDPTEDIPNDDFDPGDELSASFLGDVFLGDVWRLIGRATLHALHHGRAGRRRGLPAGRRDRHRRQPGVAPGAVVGRRVPAGHLPLQVRPPQRGRPGRRGVREQLGNEIRGGRDGRVHHRRRLDGPGDDGRPYVAANDYPSSDPLYDGGRFKIAVGPGVTWTLSRTFALDASVRVVLSRRGAQPDLPRGRELSMACTRTCA